MGKKAERDPKTGKMKATAAKAAKPPKTTPAYKSGRKKPTLQLAIFSKQEEKWKALPEAARAAGYESASHLAMELIDGWMEKQDMKKAIAASHAKNPPKKAERAARAPL